MRIVTPEPKWNSRLANTIIQLEQLKDKSVSATTNPYLFFQLKELFHIVEALASARIEGNHTTLASYVEKRNDRKYKKTDRVKEINNLFEALNFIDKNILETTINSRFVKELHRYVVNGLATDGKGEGDKRAGAYRKHDVKISQSSYTPPPYFDVDDRMRELFEYINEDSQENISLLKIAIAHHRFVWIHPFGNGNGRTARLFTYAMLCKEGYIKPNQLRLFNPTAMFVNDRLKYYKMLNLADDLNDEHILDWCEYFLDGIKDEVEKSSRLADEDFVRDELLLPSIEKLSKNGIVSKMESEILWRTALRSTIRARDISDLWQNNKSHSAISNQIRKMRDENYLRPITRTSREYTINIIGNKIITRYVLEQMDSCGMLPVRIEEGI